MSAGSAISALCGGVQQRQSMTAHTSTEDPKGSTQHPQRSSMLTSLLTSQQPSLLRTRSAAVSRFRLFVQQQYWSNRDEYDAMGQRQPHTFDQYFRFNLAYLRQQWRITRKKG